MFSDLPTVSEPVKAVLQKHADDLLPLTRSPQNGNQDDAGKLQAVSAADLFPGARRPDAALSGLLLLLNCWEESHAISQNIESREGSYWHGIAHRIEPDSFNAGYWFRKTGKHPVFTELYTEAQRILDQAERSSGTMGWRLPSSWDPFLFIDWCDEARAKPGSPQERVALDIQGAEWKLLFRWCAAPRA